MDEFVFSFLKSIDFILCINFVSFNVLLLLFILEELIESDVNVSEIERSVKKDWRNLQGIANRICDKKCQLTRLIKILLITLIIGAKQV